MVHVLPYETLSSKQNNWIWMQEKKKTRIPHKIGVGLGYLFVPQQHTLQCVSCFSFHSMSRIRYKKYQWRVEKKNIENQINKNSRQKKKVSRYIWNWNREETKSFNYTILIDIHFRFRRNGTVTHNEHLCCPPVWWRLAMTIADGEKKRKEE